MSEIMILAVYFELKQLKKQPEKKFRLEWDSNPVSQGHGFKSCSSLNFVWVAFSTA